MISDYIMNQCKRRVHNNSVDVRFMSSSTNQRKYSIESKYKQSSGNKKNFSPAPRIYNTHKISIIKQSKE